MLLDGVRSWLGPPIGFGESATAGGGSPSDPAAPLLAVKPPPKPWTAARIELNEQLWGEGFLFPGGAEETLRLAGPLGLTATATLLLLGAGAGGPPRAIASALGAWVTGFEADPELAAVAAESCARARLGRRAQVEMWYPSAPGLRVQAYHHGFALEPLRDGPPEPVLSALATALRPSGRLVMVELVADQPLDPADPTVAAWSRLERRAAPLPTERAVTRIFGRLGLHVRAAEDISHRHARLAMSGWAGLLRGLRARPSPAAAALLVAEAELWLLRLRLMREGRLRLVRWHASGQAEARSVIDTLGGRP